MSPDRALGDAAHRAAAVLDDAGLRARREGRKADAAVLFRLSDSVTRPEWDKRRGAHSVKLAGLTFTDPADLLQTAESIAFLHEPREFACTGERAH